MARNFLRSPPKTDLPLRDLTERKRKMVLMMPKRVKHRKQHRGRRKGKSSGASSLAFGEYGIQAIEPSWVTNRQIEAARIVLSRYVRRGGKMWVRVFPDKPVTAKPAETRMGKGKGEPASWVAVVKPGRVLFELEGIPEEFAREAMSVAANKLPMGTRFISRRKAG